jgi:hypothetical protein
MSVKGDEIKKMATISVNLGRRGDQGISIEILNNNGR